MVVRLKATLTGHERYGRAISQLRLPKAEPIYRRSLMRCAEEVKETTRREVLAGQMLRRITGELEGSVRISSRGLPRFVDVGSSLVQAPVLAYGWPGRNIEPHPFMARGTELSMPVFPGIWIQEMDRQVSRAK